jgi:hypothetical protein
MKPMSLQVGAVSNLEPVEIAEMDQAWDNLRVRLHCITLPTKIQWVAWIVRGHG